MRRRFFVENFGPDSATLRGETAEHLGRVLRAEPGQLYELSDGQTVWLGRIDRVHLPKRGDAQIDFALVEPVASREPELRIVLLLSLVKFDRFEWCLEKATELGVTEIVPLAAARTDKPLIAAAAKRRARWEKILVESAQQARRLRPPNLRMGTGGDGSGSAAEILSRRRDAFRECTADRKIILSERPDAPALRQPLSAPTIDAVSAVHPISAALAVGPEGGWTAEELQSARAAGFVEASLGQNILRTETAVIAAMAILGFALG